MALFKFSAFQFLKGRQTPLEQQKSKNVIDFLFRKWNLIIRFPSELQYLRIDPVFSNWVNFMKKLSIINYSRNSLDGNVFFSSKFEG